MIYFKSKYGFLFFLNILSKFSHPVENSITFWEDSWVIILRCELRQERTVGSLALQGRHYHASAVHQDVLVQFGNSLWIHWSRQEMCEFLMSFGPGTISWSSVFVKCHKIPTASVPMFIYVGWIGIIPVLFKLLPKDAFRSQFLL